MEEDLMRGRDVEPPRVGDYVSGDCELLKGRLGGEAFNAVGKEIEQDASSVDGPVRLEVGAPISSRGFFVAGENDLEFDAVAERPAS
jgi:hypothetical protein